MSLPRFDVAIVGGGVIGCAIARELSRYQLSVILLEKNAEVGFGTSKTNSGIIHPGHDTPLSTLKGRLVARGNAMFDHLQEELGFGFERIGELNVARRVEELPQLEALMRQGEEKGVPGMELWDAARLRREEPNLSPSLAGALYLPSGGVINPYELAFSLIENAVDNGVTLQVDSPVTAITPVGEGLRLETPKGSLESRYVLNCAGVFADRIAELAGCRTFEIFPRKGEEYMLDKRLKGLVRHLIFPLPEKHTKGILIIPTVDGTIMVGPTAVSVSDREDVATSNLGMEQVFSSVRALCPAIDPRDAITAFAGLRAVSSSEDFIIGPTATRGFINVAGIQSPGLTSAPAIAEYVCDLLWDEGLRLRPKPDFRPFLKSVPRFSALSWEERDKLIAQDPSFARVVCRCELVTEGELKAAIEHGARTLDGIKFRTRAGMGRCQGSFCTSRCMDLLSRRLGIPLHEVTKRGGGSWIAAPMEDVSEEEA